MAKVSKKAKLDIGYKYCEDNDKSEEFMFNYMMDYAQVGMSEVFKYLEKYQGWERID